MTGDEALSLDQILAAKLGETGPVVNVDEPKIKLLVLTLGADWFAFPGDKVREVLPDCPVFYLPGCPSSLEGVINVRGEIETVIDLRALLGYPPSPTRAGSRILLCHAAGMVSGIRADSVEDVTDVLQSAIQAPPHTIPEKLKPIMLGIVPFRGRLVTLLDLERLFGDYRDRLM